MPQHPTVHSTFQGSGSHPSHSACVLFYGSNIKQNFKIYLNKAAIRLKTIFWERKSAQKGEKNEFVT